MALPSVAIPVSLSASGGLAPLGSCWCGGGTAATVSLAAAAQGPTQGKEQEPFLQQTDIYLFSQTQCRNSIPSELMST